MLSIMPRQRAGEKGVMFKLVKSSSSEVHCETLFQSELIYSAKKDASVSLGNQRKENRGLFPFCLS